MKSLTIASLLLYALWLPNYIVEGSEMRITECKVENPIPGTAILQKIDLEDGKFTGSELDIQEEINPSLLSVHITITNGDDDVMFDQTIDFCSMGTNDLFKNYFMAFEQPEFNEGSCPINPGSYRSGGFDVDIGDAPEGTYVCDIVVSKGPNEIIKIKSTAEIQE